MLRFEQVRKLDLELEGTTTLDTSASACIFQSTRRLASQKRMFGLKPHFEIEGQLITKQVLFMLCLHLGFLWGSRQNEKKTLLLLLG